MIVLALTGGGAGALAAEPIAKLHSTAKVSPKRTGTDRAPRPAVIEGYLGWVQTYDEQNPTHIRVLMSRRLSHAGRGRPICSSPATYEEAWDCPAGSVIGTINAGGAPPFNAHCSSDAVLVNGGSNRVHVAASGGCIRFDEVELGTLVKLRHRKWRYRLTLPMPGVLRYSTPTSDSAFMYYSLGERPPSKAGFWTNGQAPVPSGYWRTTGCPASGRHAIRVEIPHSGSSDASGVSATRAESRCRAAVSPAPAEPS